ncbi:hypothetical protein HZR84_13980 [Hyphobacterium sp. CCMP332]|nr:hypothetical protein HZR84_13980 [Hyphobacterium sp. CCMP332]
MKFKAWIINLKAPRLIIEAVLIFGSVYFALILEADRSRDFEREILIGKLEKLEREIRYDSLKYSDMLSDGKENGIILQPDIDRDSISARLLKLKPLHWSDTLVSLYKNDLPYSMWTESWMKESLTFNSILENHDYLILNEGTYSELEFYFRYRNALNEDNNQDVKIFYALEGYLEDKFPRPEFRSVTEWKEIVKTTFFQNCIMARLEIKRDKRSLSTYLLSTLESKKAIIKNEIEAQKDAMEGIF